MFSWFKKHFIPHKGNDHRPHILRNISMRNIVAIVIFLEIFTFLIPILTHLNMTGGMAAVLPAVLSDLTNAERESQKFSVLKINPTLNKVAEMKAEDMAINGYFAHTSPEGKTPWYWFEQIGYKYQYAGENLAINFSDSKDVTNAWMNSPTHRENIVKENYTEVGTGIATGMYEGRSTIFVVQVYANPIQKKVVKDLAILPSTPSKVIKSIEKEILEVATFVKSEPEKILGIEAVANIENVSTNTNPTFWQKLLASPRNTTNVILYIVFMIVVFALFLYIIIKIRNHHVDLITNGLITLAVIGAIFVANHYLGYRNMVIATSLDFSYDTK